MLEGAIKRYKNNLLTAATGDRGTDPDSQRDPEPPMKGRSAWGCLKTKSRFMTRLR